MLSCMRARFCTQVNLCPQSILLIGFHGDERDQHNGLNYAFTEVYSWTYLAVEDGDRNLFTLVAKNLLCGGGCTCRRTANASVELFDWSLQVLLGGYWPTARHDGDLVDAPRAKQVGTPLGFHGGLQQARGDRAF